MKSVSFSVLLEELRGATEVGGREWRARARRERSAKERSNAPSGMMMLSFCLVPKFDVMAPGATSMMLMPKDLTSRRIVSVIE